MILRTDEPEERTRALESRLEGLADESEHFLAIRNRDILRDFLEETEVSFYWVTREHKEAILSQLPGSIN